MSKAFDRIEWTFLEKMLEKMGFPPAWTRNVMCCVRFVQYEIKYNDQISDTITPGRGLRQGDPLSPYLFILCSEWLSWQITRNQADQKFDDISICRGAPPVTHLFFADDSLLFFKTTQRSIATVKHVLSEYESISDQKIHYSKFEVCLSKNISLPDSLDITNTL